MEQKELKQLLDYDPDTGIFTCRVSRGNRSAGAEAGYIDNRGYRKMSVNRVIYAAHRLAFLYMEGYLPENEVDHINGIKDDNRWCNLREVSRSCNQLNIATPNNNTSGRKGVYKRRSGKYRAIIGENNRLIDLGTFDTFEEAVAAREKAEAARGC